MNPTSTIEDLLAGIKKQQELGKLARFFQSKDDAATVKTLFRRVSTLLEVFQVRV
jgi:hypothetical protein